MRFLGCRFWSLVGAIAFSIGFALPAGATVSTSASNKVIIYPGPNDSIDQLKQQGIEKVDNYGSYWVAQVGDKNLVKLKAKFGSRVVSANDLNHVELRSGSIDTMGNEPSVPADMEQVESPGRRLRIVQFKGPIQPEWLTKLESLNGVQVINYVPNNAYLVFLDAAAEKEVRALRDPSGPVQWVGAYHPWYKLTPELQNADFIMDVRVAVVDAPEAETALEFIRSFARQSQLSTTRVPNQRMISARLDAAALSEIARLPEVLWIDPINRIRPMDEVQALILASDTNSPGPGVGAPLPPASGGQHYLDFLTTAVGGGNAAFTNPLAYPVIDVADSGFSASPPGLLDFFEPSFGLRVLYATYDISCGPYSIPKQTLGSATCVAQIKNGGGDDTLAIGHGTAIASIISGFNTNVVNQDPSGFQFGMGVSPYGLVGSTRVFEPFLVVDDGTVCLYHIDDDFCVVNFPQLIFNEYADTARISNNSWDEGLVFGNVANANAGLYDATCQQYDIGVRDAQATGSTNTPTPFPLNQEMITVFANGNAGNVGNAGGFGDTTLTPPATSKNVISVGATTSVRQDGSGCEPSLLEENSFQIALYSAFGPTLDGRFKPEIVAPDTTIYGVASTFWTNAAAGTGGSEGDTIPPQIVGVPSDTNNIYLCGSGPTSIVLEEPTPTAFNAVRGTSFSAPAISGGIQLLWWYFQNRLTDELGTPLLQPSPAMAKAYLCNSARYLPITDPATHALDTLPSIEQGMGMMDLQKMFDQVPRVIRDESTRRAIDSPLITTNPVPQQTFFSQSGQTYQSSGQIFDPTKPFRVSLAWTDAPGTPGTGKQLVNDLNLEVTIGGQTYKGNVFSGPNSIVGGSADSLNNMESVFLPAGQTGAWNVVVRAADIAGQGVPNVGSSLGQDFALVIYNAASTNRSDVPNLLTNNTCGTAVVITDDSFSFTNILSTTGSNAYHRVHPSPSAAIGGSEEFFKLTNPTPGSQFTISTTGSSFDNVLSIWRVQVVPEAVFVRGECGALIEVISTNGGNSSVVAFTADGSNDYYIVAEPHNNGPGGQFVLNVNASISTIVVTPGSLTFPSIPVGLTSTVQSVTLQNNTTVSIGISSVSITGSNAADFVIESQSCAGGPVSPGRNCTVNIGFSPSVTGPESAQLVITDDQTGSPRIVPLSGTGTPAVPVICLGSATNTFDFGSQLLTTTSAVQSITITNCGSAVLNISNVFVTGFGSNDFSVTQTCTGGSIAPGSICTLNITFNPQVAGARQANVLLANNISPNPTLLTLTGTGIALTPAVCFGGNSLDFGSLLQGTTGSVQTIILTNCGTASLVISNLSITGANTGDFIIVSSSCVAVTTGTICSVTLEFAPSAGGPRSANLAFVDNIPGSPQLLSLTGNGALSQPDAAIGKTDKLKKMVGAGIINTTGAGQEVVQNIHRGAKKGLRFFVTLRNIGSAPDRFTVQGDGNATGFTVNYFLGAIPKESVDVTADVESGVFSSDTLAADAVTSVSTMLRIEVFADKTLVAKGVTKTFNLTFTSVSDPTKVDVVKATVQAK